VERKVHADREGPVLSIDEPVAGSGLRPGPLKLKGYAYDDSGLQEIRVNGRDMHPVQGREVRLDYVIPAAENPEAVVVEARDRAGNLTKAEIHLSRKEAVAPKVLLASLDPVHLVSTDSPKPGKDNLPPTIELKWAEEQTVFLDQVYLEGSVRDNQGVAYLIINGQSILRKPGKNIYFNHLSTLKEGENSFQIEARNEAGNQAEKRVLIYRKIPRIRDLGSRLRVALMPLERQGESPLTKQPVEDTLLNRLVERKRFVMVERRRLDDLLKELKLSQSELINPDAAARVGKLLAANGALIGSVVARENSLEIIVRLVDTETATIITVADAYGEDIDAQLLRLLCQGLSVKLNDELPLAEGIVVKVKGNRLLTDLGEGTKVKKGMRLIVFEEQEPVRHPVTGMVLGSDPEPLGHGLIMAVQEQMSDALVLEEGILDRLKPMQKVITQ
jgi:hypothetical protein